MSTASALRSLTADTALRLGPEAATLCSPWTVRDLIAHLIIREARPDTLPGIGLSGTPLGRHTASVQEDVAHGEPFEELVERFRSGPPAWSPTRLAVVDSLVNTAELAIHHEDMVRAQPGWSPTVQPGQAREPLDGQPQTAQLHDPQLQEALWRTLTKAGKLLYRSAPVGVVAVADGYGRAALRRPRPDSGTVVLRGTPLELLLHAFGRDGVAQVEAQGADDDVALLAEHTRAA